MPEGTGSMLDVIVSIEGQLSSCQPTGYYVGYASPVVQSVVNAIDGGSVINGGDLLTVSGDNFGANIADVHVFATRRDVGVANGFAEQADIISILNGST